MQEKDAVTNKSESAPTGSHPEAQQSRDEGEPVIRGHGKNTEDKQPAKISQNTEITTADSSENDGQVKRNQPPHEAYALTENLEPATTLKN